MRLRTIATAAIAIAAPVALAIPTGAVVAPDAWNYDPVTGPAGTEITVSGVCNTSTDYVSVDIWLMVPPTTPTTEITAVELPGTIAHVNIPITPDENWETTLTVPEGTDPGTIMIARQCAREGGGGGATSYGEFEVLAATTTTQAPTTTTAPSTTTTAAPAALPATLRPTFAG